MKEISNSRVDPGGLSARLRKSLEAWTVWQQAGSVCAFSPMPDEPVLFLSWPEGKQVAFPVVSGEQLSARWVAGFSELKPGAFGILEPANEAPCAGNTFDLILVPGLAFDRRGGRLGRGKGYYDRFLSETGGLRAGICFEDQVVEEIPGEAHDIRMDFLITPAGIFPCAP